MTAALDWSKTGIRPLLIAGVVLLVAWPLLWTSPYDLRIVTIVGIYALLALGYQFIFGHAGALALTQGTFFGVGAYVTAILSVRYAIGGELTLVLSIAVPVALAALIAAPVLRLESHYFALATLGIGQVMLLIAVAWQDFTGGSNGISGIPALNVFGVEAKKGYGLLAFVWTCVAAGAFLSWRITRGLYGAGLAISRENPVAALSLGIDIAKLRYAMFLLSAMFAGLAGALYAHTIRVVSPEALEFPIMVACLTIAVVGGRTHIAGAILGAFLIVNLPEWFRAMEKYYLIAYGLALLAMIIAAPYGLIGLLEQWRSRLWPERPREIPQPELLVTSRVAVTNEAPLLEIRGVTKRFGGLKALDDVSLTVARGEIFGLIGPNGSGKTTLLNIVTGIYRADAGSVVLDALPIHDQPSFVIAQGGIARTFQNVNLVDEMTVLDNVAVARYGFARAGLRQVLAARASDPAWRRARAHALYLLDSLGVASVAQSTAGSLAYGVKRKVEVARGLALEPKLLLLDEPAAGLNEVEQLDLAQRLRGFAANGLAILVIEHNMTFLMPLAQRMACLNHGELIAVGTPAEIRANRTVIEAYLGAPEPVAA
ncbi:MAG TPA: branched-chain amino acid ABC transporter ATP-binding protein/permease [Casimicrobiaceae bacterium]|nr:branched-chain amino acid ABC transporter ATP-binding protein/permease [Casimicrobiaceae bacterium]